MNVKTMTYSALCSRLDVIEKSVRQAEREVMVYRHMAAEIEAELALRDDESKEQ